MMKDQIEALKALGVPAAMLSSKTDQGEQKAVSAFEERGSGELIRVRQILDDMESGHPRNRLLYSACCFLERRGEELTRLQSRLNVCRLLRSRSDLPSSIASAS